MIEPKTAEFTIQGEKFILKEPLGYDDEALIVTYTEPMTGKLLLHELYCVRLSKALVTPPMGVNDVRKLPASVFNTLVEKWHGLTAPDKTAFL